MQIVIEISDERYEQIKRCVDELLTGELERAIKNGTPLQKGHGRLIDEHNLVFENIECTDGNIYMVVHAPYVDGASTIIEADKEE